MNDLVFRQIIDGHGFCHEHGVVAASDDECCPFCGATAHGVEMVRLAQETMAEITRLKEKNARLCRLAEIDLEDRLHRMTEEDPAP